MLGGTASGRLCNCFNTSEAEQANIYGIILRKRKEMKMREKKERDGRVEEMDGMKQRKEKR